MKNKFAFLISAVTFLTISTFAMAESASLEVKLESPKSPVNKQDLSLTFVALDIENREVAIKCQKKSSSDADFVQFGDSQTLKAGGNSGICSATSTQISSKGTYEFRVAAVAGSETRYSNIVSIEYNPEAPSAVNDYKKEKISECTYKISFKTADDGGKTSYVEVYRGTSGSFVADTGARIAKISLGSNQTSSVENTVSDCSKNNYFAVRAFNSAGIGSGIVGDSYDVIDPSLASTTTTPTSVAIVSGNSQVRQGSILGAKDDSSTISATATPTGQIDDKAASDDANKGILGSTTSKSKVKYLVGIGIVTALVYAFLQSKDDSEVKPKSKKGKKK